MNYNLEINLAFLIGSIEKPIEKLRQASGMISSSYGILQEHYKKIEDYLGNIETYFIPIFRLMTSIREQNERVKKIFSLKVCKGKEPGKTDAVDLKLEEENRILNTNNDNVRICI